jgi:DNA-binding PadR family transcriptional regulator
MTEHNSNTLQPALLGYLVEGPKHAYELNQEFNQSLGMVWRLGQSMLYTQLKNLASSGLLEMEIIPQPSRPARKMYQLTLAGKEVFLSWLQQPVEHLRSIRLEFLIRLYFFRRLGIPGLENLVLSQKAILQTQINALLREAHETDDDYWRLVLEFRRGQTDAVINWLDFCANLEGEK